MKKSERIAQLVTRVEALENALLKNIMVRDVCVEPIQEEEPVPEQDKFAELKEAHRNGAVIEYYCVSSRRWRTATVPSWDTKTEYRIKPEEGPKVGDYVKAWVNSEDLFVIGKIKDISDTNENKFGVQILAISNIQSAIYYPYVRTITKQEAINLLFGEVENLVLPEIRKDGFLSDEEYSYKIDIFKSNKEEGRVTVYKNKNYLTGKELINLLFGHNGTNGLEGQQD